MRKTFQCPKCEMISHNENDAKERWCSNCQTSFACEKCGGKGVVAATPGIGADGTVPCECALDYPSTRLRVIPNEMREGCAFVVYDRGPVCGTAAPQPWDIDAARTRYIANHSVFHHDLPTTLAHAIVREWNKPENWQEWNKP